MEAVESEGRGEREIGVYLHVPFCERVCPYCDFAVVGGRLTADDEARYVAALCAELEHRKAVVAERPLASVYLGGGTPSLLTPDSVALLVNRVREASGLPDAAPEVTLEVNPSTLERSRLRGFRDAGVSRLSVGIQSFDDAVLKRLGRAHRAIEGRRTIDAARAAGFRNVSLDLIFAAPGQTLASLDGDLDQIAELRPEHVSTYELVVEAGTPFATADARGQLPRATTDEAQTMIERIDERLARAGIHRYELTNYARPGRESVHNRRYWERAPVLGLGLGAWSSDAASKDAPYGSRRMNTRKLADYLERVETGSSATDHVEVHDARTARGEAVFLALRCSTGLAASRFSGWFGNAPRAWFADEIDRLVARGLLAESEAGDLRLTAHGRRLCDEVSQAFV